jgi:dimethylamine/trimethylamine dehydrogenase
LGQHAIQKHILDLGIELMLNRNVVEYHGANLAVECTYTGRRTMIASTMIVAVTFRLPDEELALELAGMPERIEDALSFPSHPSATAPHPS